MLKRFMCLLLVLVMVAGMLPLQIMAEEIRPPETTEETEPPETTEETEPPETTEETEPPATTEETEPPETTEETEPPATTEETEPPATTAETEPPETTEETEPPETTAETEPPAEVPMLTTLTLFEEDEGYTEADMLTEYFQREMMGGGISAFGLGAGNSLDETNRKVYDTLLPFLREIAEGKRTSSILLLGKYAMMGVEPDVKMSIDVSKIDLDAVKDALKYDYSYLLYWHDMYNKGIQCWMTSNSIMFIFNVAQKYRGGTATTLSNGSSYHATVNINKTHAPLEAVENAKRLVAANAGKSDYKKLLAYANWISDAVTYDSYAADNKTASEDVDPWQIIHVFDGDPGTNVVCEGYAKSMQMLCDLTYFDADIECYCVTGVNHMWNILRIDGASYLLDVTGYDGDGYGYVSDYFLAGGAPDSRGGYRFGTMYYAYYDEIRQIWSGTDVLTLADDYYIRSIVPEEPTQVEITLDGSSVNNWIIRISQGSQFQLGAAVYPETFSQRVLWSSNNPEVASISPEGLLTAVGAGTTTIFAYVPESPESEERSDLYAMAVIEVEQTHRHIGTLQNVREATCTVQGYSGDLVCVGCGAVLQEGSATPVLDHDPQRQGERTATCTTDGYTGDLVCVDCGQKTREGTVIPSLGHIPMTVGAFPATCTADGYSGNTKCTVCQEVYEYGRVLPAPGHVPELIGAAEAACTVNGYTGDKKCTVCQEVYEYGQVIPAPGHAPELIDAAEAACTVNGYTGDKKCSVCREVYEYGQVIPAPGHVPELIDAAEAACTVNGYSGDKKCTVCQEVYERGAALPMLGHETQIVGAVQPTCTADGYTGDEKCTRCQALLASGGAVPAQGHLPRTITVPKKAATSTVHGHSSFKVLSCFRCSQWFNEDLSEMTQEQAEALKQKYILYATAKSLRIYCGDGTAVPKTINGKNYPEALQLKAVVSPAAASQKVTWSTSSKSVAKVDKNGLVTFLTNGKVTITAKTGNKKTYSVTMTVKTLAESVQITGADQVYATKTLSLKTRILPAAAKDTVKWSLSKADQKYASISSKGVLTPKKTAIPAQGVTVTVVAAAQDGSGVKGTMPVTIQPAVSSVAVSGPENKTYDLLLDSGDIVLTASTKPEPAKDQVKWSIRSGKIKTVAKDDTSITLRPTKNGTYVIRAEATDGSKKYVDYKLKVITSVEKLSLKAEYTLSAGQKLTLKPTIAPSNASNQKYTWSHDPLPSGVTFKSGVITVSTKLKTAQTFTVTATSSDKKAVNPSISCQVTVRPAATKVALTRDGEAITAKTLQHTTDETLQLGALVSPTGEAGASQAVKWSTSNKKIATVTQQGLVDFKAPGTVTITATAADGSKKAKSIKITVRQLVKSLKLPETAVVGSGRSLTLKPSVSPSNASNKKYTWSHDPLPAGVTFKSGVITVSKSLKTVQTFMVRAVSADGGAVETECLVTVRPAATKVTLNRGTTTVNSKTLKVSRKTPLQLTATVSPTGENGACQTVKWTTSSSKIATVTQDGLVKFKKAGTVTITATAIDGTKVKAYVKLTAK